MLKSARLKTIFLFVIQINQISSAQLLTDLGEHYNQLSIDIGYSESLINITYRITHSMQFKK